MNILQITPEAPSSRSGGGIGVRQTLLSLLENGDQVDYVGPEITEEPLKALYRRTYILEPSHNVLLRIYDTLFMNTNRRYRAWKALKLDIEAYDLIVMDFTKLHYVLERIGDMPLLVRVHNVEQDYSRNDLRHHRTLVHLLDAAFSGPRERRIVRRADRLLVLTEKDQNRLCSLYQISKGKTKLLPVCIPAPKKAESGKEKCDQDRRNEIKEKKETTCTQTPLRLLITGSLWFGSNYEGTIWFLDEVFAKLGDAVSLCIAGARPHPSLVQRVQSVPNIRLIDTPPDMAPYFREADLFIAPVFDGAGMKVKVAEALSYGLPVVGTSHAFEGYEITEGLTGWQADDAASFLAAVSAYRSLSEAERMKRRHAAERLFNARYSIACSAAVFQETIKQMRADRLQ